MLNINMTQIFVYVFSYKLCPGEFDIPSYYSSEVKWNYLKGYLNLPMRHIGLGRREF